jgi:hypothetical protein
VIFAIAAAVSGGGPDASGSCRSIKVPLGIEQLAVVDTTGGWNGDIHYSMLRGGVPAHLSLPSCRLLLTRGDVRRPSEQMSVIYIHLIGEYLCREVCEFALVNI